MADADARFADVIDSMGFVEFLTLLSDDYGVTVERLEQAVGRRYGTIAELAAALQSSGLRSKVAEPSTLFGPFELPSSNRPPVWLAATSAGLPVRKQPASTINALLHRPDGWLENHAGIQARGLWDGEDVLDVAARTARDCLRQAGIPLETLGVLLVTSEAPPILTGLAAALHQRLRLSASVVALEIGGACTGFLAAMWTARRLLLDTTSVLIVAIEAPSRWLTVEPGPAGETAALFGDATAACVLTAQPTTASIRLRDIVLATSCTGGDLLRPQQEPTCGVSLHMEGIPLAQRALRIMADTVRQMSQRHGLRWNNLAAIVAHGGNGRLPALLARRLSLSAERVWSATAHTGNLGSASLPVAWTKPTGPIATPAIWTSVGAGLQWGAALFDAQA